MPTPLHLRRRFADMLPRHAASETAKEGTAAAAEEATEAGQQSSRLGTCPICTLTYDPAGTPQGLCHNALVHGSPLDKDGNPRLRGEEKHRAARQYIEADRIQKH